MDESYWDPYSYSVFSYGHSKTWRLLGYIKDQEANVQPLLGSLQKNKMEAFHVAGEMDAINKLMLNKDDEFLAEIAIATSFHLLVRLEAILNITDNRILTNIVVDLTDKILQDAIHYQIRNSTEVVKDWVNGNIQMFKVPE